MLINKQQFCNVNFDPVDRNPSLNKKKKIYIYITA